MEQEAETKRHVRDIVTARLKDVVLSRGLGSSHIQQTMIPAALVAALVPERSLPSPEALARPTDMKPKFEIVDGQVHAATRVEACQLISPSTAIWRHCKMTVGRALA